MTAKQLLNYIDEIKDDEELDYIQTELDYQKGNIAVQIECCTNRKKMAQLQKAKSDLQEKLDAVQVIKYQRLLIFKWASQKEHGVR